MTAAKACSGDFAEQWAKEMRSEPAPKSVDRSDESWLHDDPDILPLRDRGLADELRARAATNEPMRLRWLADIELATTSNDLIKGLLSRGALSVVYGEPGCGKTFFVLDLALSVARGLTWRGRRTRKGLAVYVAGEGARSVEMRALAYRQARLQAGADRVPFVIYPAAVNLLDPGGELVHVLGLIAEAEKECEESAALIVLSERWGHMEGW